MSNHLIYCLLLILFSSCTFFQKSSHPNLEIQGPKIAFFSYTVSSFKRDILIKYNGNFTILNKGIKTNLVFDGNNYIEMFTLDTVFLEKIYLNLKMPSFDVLLAGKAENSKLSKTQLLNGRINVVIRNNDIVESLPVKVLNIKYCKEGRYLDYQTSNIEIPKDIVESILSNDKSIPFIIETTISMSNNVDLLLPPAIFYGDNED